MTKAAESEPGGIENISLLLPKILTLYTNSDYYEAKQQIEEGLHKIQKLKETEGDALAALEYPFWGIYALVLSGLGAYPEALTSAEKSFALISKYAASDVEIGNVTFLLAQSYHYNARYLEAKIHLKNAHALYLKTSEQDFYKLGSVNDLYAYIAIKEKNYSAADSLFKVATTYLDKFTATVPLLKANRQGVIANNLRQLGRFKEARKELKTAFSYQAESDKWLSNLAAFDIALSEAEGDSAAMFRSINNYLKLQKGILALYFPVFTEGQKTQFIELFGEGFNIISSVLSRHTEGAKYLYDLTLLQKSVALADIRGIQQKLNQLPEGRTKNTALQLATKMKVLNNDKTSLDIQVKLNREADSLRTVLKNDTTAKKLFANDWITTVYKDVQAKLQENEVAVEFFDFKYQTTTLPADSTMYYALILRHKGDPSVIPLFEEKELIKLFDETRFYKHDSKTNAPILSDEQTVKSRYNKENGKKLYDLIWKPLENAQILRGVQTVHFAPSGLLNRVAFAALPVGGNLEQLLLHTYTLRQYNTTRALVETMPRPTPQAKDLVAFGNIQYGSCQQDSSGRASIKTIPLEKADSLVARSALFLDSVKIHWSALPNSKRELANIEKSHKKYQPNAAFTAFTGYNASEARFKTLGTRGKLSPSHLFISTHGYGNPTNYPKSSYASDALHRAGLVMATANWTTECPIKRNIEEEDGILTAYEIAQLNFSNTELVVLSGCQTGLGDIWGREGVFGLTRGFKLAGVNHIIASLWAVPDKDTADFMTTFYDSYLSGKSITKAFEDTQKAMQQEQSVYSWGAWVLIK